MRLRASLAIAVPVGLSYLIAGLMLGRSAPGQLAAPSANSAPGRFLASVGGQAPYVVVIDTATGHRWTHLADCAGDGTDLEAPPPA